MLFDFGGRFPVWPIFLTVSTCYFAGRRMGRARPALILFAVIAVLGFPVTLIFRHGELSSWGEMAGVLVFGALFPWQLGHYVRLREDLVRSGWRRAEAMETQQHLIADQARLRERARIASDMHDSLGHELSLIAVRAAALQVAGGLNETQQVAASELRESAAVATDRLRQIFGVLREGAAPTEPVHESIVDLVERARASGLLIQSGLDTPDQVAVSAMVDKAAYRVVQESLTNVAKHAPGAAVTVRVARSDGETTVLVINERPSAGPLPGVASGHRGLAGLRERVRFVGGTLLAAPRVMRQRRGDRETAVASARAESDSSASVSGLAAPGAVTLPGGTVKLSPSTTVFSP